MKLALLALLLSFGGTLIAAPLEGADPYLRQSMGFPPKRSDWHFEIHPEKSPWTYRVSLFEGAELYLGTRIFMSLPTRFQKIRGVTRVEQEDREWYLFQTKGITSGQLQEALWQQFQGAATEAFQR